MPHRVLTSCSLSDMRWKMLRRLRRMELTEQDVSTLWRVVVRLVEGPRENVQTRKRHRPPKTQP